MTPRKPLNNRQFGNLKVLAYAGKNRHGNSLWLCECKCGTKTTVVYQHLTAGRTRSCGGVGCRWKTMKEKKI